MTNSYDFGMVIVTVPTPALAALALAVLLLSALFWLCFALWWRRTRKTFRQTRATLFKAAPQVTQEIFIDEDGFSLLGPRWQWTGNVPIDYGCPECGGRVKTVLRQYYNRESRQTYSLMRHGCTPVLDTIPLEAIKKKE